MNKFGPIIGWRNYKQQRSLVGQACMSCKKVFYPKKYLCDCGNDTFTEQKLSGKGTLVTFTQVHHPPAGFEAQVPYCLGIVELEEGVRVLAQLADVGFEDLKMGMSVAAVIRKLSEEGDAGIISYGVKFVPEKA